MTVTAKLQKLDHLYNPLYCQGTLNICFLAPCWAVFSCQIPILQLNTLRVKDFGNAYTANVEPSGAANILKGRFKFPLRMSPRVWNILNLLLSSQMLCHLASGFIPQTAKLDISFFFFFLDKVERAHSSIHTFDKKGFVEYFLKCY